MASQAFSLLNLCTRLERFQLEFGTDISWSVLEQIPAYLDSASWEVWKDAFQCLGALRGLKWGSIKGVSPDIYSLEETYGPEVLTEVENARVEVMKQRWMRPKVLRSSRVQRAFEDLKASTRKVIRGKPRTQFEGDDGSIEFDE